MAIFHFKSGRTQDQNEEYIETPADPQEDTSNVEPDSTEKITVETKDWIAVFNVVGHTINKKE